MKLAGAMVVQDYDPRYGTFPCLKSLSDFTTVLDDNSESLSNTFDLFREADEHLLLSRKDGTLWNDTANRTMLMYRAYLAGCHYVLPWSADVLPSNMLYGWITACPFANLPDGPDFFQCELREIWNSPDNWRSDGIWGQKSNVFLQRNWFFDSAYRMPDSEERLHKYPHPRGWPPVIKNLEPGYCIYHFGGMTPEQRAARVSKYAIEDAGNEFQKDYTYLADETGLQLSPVAQEDLDFFKQWMKV